MASDALYNLARNVLQTTGTSNDIGDENNYPQDEGNENNVSPSEGLSSTQIMLSDSKKMWSQLRRDLMTYTTVLEN